MRFSESPYKCPYPLWVMMLTEYLFFGLMCTSLLLTLEDAGRYAADIFATFCIFLVAIVMFAGTLFSMIAVSLLLVGSVWAAFQNGFVFGWVYMILLAPLIIPHFHTQALIICFVRRERKKMQSFVGREGTVTESQGPYTSTIEIDGEEFDAGSTHYMPVGATIVVVKTYRVGFEIKLKPPETDA
jgi:membrane-bound ClpP family serine protease